MCSRRTDQWSGSRTAAGVDEMIPRKEISEMAAGNSSMMPQELEQGMSHQELADLLGYLKGE